MITSYELASHVFKTPGGVPCQMEYRKGTNDWNVLWSSLIEDEYRLPRIQKGTAVDVGGYLGSVGIALALDNPRLRVLIVEPVPANWDLIERNIVANGVDRRVSLIRAAVGRAGQTVEVRWGFRGNEAAEHHAFVGNLQMHEVTAREVTYQTVNYPALTLGMLVDMIGGNIPFIKIDTEGAEWDFLATPDVRYVHTIAGEWHNGSGHSRGDMLALLSATHVTTFTGPLAGPGGFLAVRR